MASSAGVSNSPILEVLNPNNYKSWRLRMKTYLIVEKLWEVVGAIREPGATPEDDELEYKAWEEKNAKALYAIQNSCGQEMFHFISETETAKTAWEALENVAKLPGRVKNNAENFELYTEFIKFVSEGDWDKAKECLKLKELDLHRAVRAIDPRDDFGDTAIHVAARKGHVHIVKELALLMTQEDLKMKNAKGYAAIHLAARNGHLPVVKELALLLTQEDLKMKTAKGNTAIHLAVLNRNVHLPVVKELALLMGEAVDNDGNTALHLAVYASKVDVVKELVLSMKQKDLEIKKNERYTALHLAVKKGNVRIVKSFLTKDKERDFNCYIQYFTYYVTKGEWDNAKKCLKELKDPCDAITAAVDPRDGENAVHVATRQGHTHIVKELISLLKVRPESSLELKTVEDIAAFGSGIKLGVSEEVVMEKAKYMVEQYEKIVAGILEAQNAYGATALYIAASKGNVDIVKELVPSMRKEGLEIQNVDGLTALIYAVKYGFMDIVKELAPKMRPEGLELKTKDGFMNALHVAAMRAKVNIMKEVVPFMRKEALGEKDGDGRTAFGILLSIRTKDEDVMEAAKYMAEHNTNVFGIPTPPNGWIPVVTAIRQGNWDLSC